MSKTQKGADDYINFINETRSGKFVDLPYNVEECQELRIDITLLENVNEPVHNVYLFGLSH